jgi:hypothetical protein
MTPSSPPTTAPALPQRLEAGTSVGRYEIDGWLRDGGMASLYRGHHVKTGAKVAIKVQLDRGAADHVTAARFDREGQVMGRLSGMPNVAQVHDVGELSDGRRYLVMEWIEGDNLEELLDDLRNADRPLDVERACRIMKDVALALAAVHRAEVVHRDLKPSNIMIDHGHPDREVAKLLDFGISVDLGGGGSSGDLTATGVVLGTSGYVAPEQALGLPAHPSFDVYAFGVVLFEALTGYGAPPEGLAPERLPPITTLRASVPPELAELVTECLQRDPSKRPPNAEALVERVDAVIRGLRRSARNEPRSSVARIEAGVEARVEAGGEPGTRAVASDERAPAEEKNGKAHAREPAAGEEPPKEPTRSHATVQGPGVPWAIVAAVVGAIAVLVIGLVAVRCGLLSRVGANGGSTHAEEDAGKPGATPARPDSGAVGSVPPAATTEDPSGSTTGSPASSGELETGPSSTGDAVNPPSSDDAETTNGPKDPPRVITSAVCVGARRRAYEAATKRRDWKAVMRETSDRRCWNAPEYRSERRALRVEALLELERFEECVEEGAGSTDPRVAKATKLCRVRSEREPG